MMSSFALVGDLDGDGCDDNAPCEPKLGSPEPGLSAKGCDLTLEEAMAFPSAPKLLGASPASVGIFSGKTQRPLAAVFGAQGSDQPVGQGAFALSDLPGEGRPELLILSGHGRGGIFLFPGAGASHGAERDD